MNLSYLNSRKDAGLFRQYIAERYGYVFIYGALSATYWAAYRLAKELAKLTGISLEQVTKDLAEDWLVTH